MAGVGIFFSLQAARLTAVSLKIDAISQKSAISEKIADEEIARVESILKNNESDLQDRIVAIKDIIDVMRHPIVSASNEGVRDSFYPNVDRGRRLFRELLRGKYAPSFQEDDEEELFRKTILIELSRMGSQNNFGDNTTLWDWESPIGIDVASEFPSVRQIIPESPCDLRHLHPDDWNFAKLSNFSTTDERARKWNLFIVEKADFQGADWTGVDIVRADVPQPEFLNSTLSNASFLYTKIRGAEFIKAVDCKNIQFVNCDLSRISITGGNWTEAEFYNNRMWRCHISSYHEKLIWKINHGDFTGNDLRSGYTDIRFQHAQEVLQSNDFRGFYFDNGLLIENAHFSGQTLTNHKLDLTGITCADALNISDSSFLDTAFTGSSLTGIASNTSFTSCQFFGADLGNLFFKSVDISGSTFGFIKEFPITVSVTKTTPPSGEIISYVIGEAPPFIDHFSSATILPEFPSRSVYIDIPGSIFPFNVEDIKLIEGFLHPFGGYNYYFLSDESNPFFVDITDQEIDPKFLSGQFLGTWMKLDVRNFLLEEIDKTVPKVDRDLRQILTNAKNELLLITEESTLIPEDENAKNWEAWEERKAWSLDTAITAELKSVMNRDHLNTAE
ncbi:MAG: hypothetical protein AAF558_00140 [Verrucomicrobiota bacterium]